MKRQYYSTHPELGTVRFSLEINEDEIADKLVRALRKSKSGKATALGGAVKAKIIPVIPFNQAEVKND